MFSFSICGIRLDRTHKIRWRFPRFCLPLVSLVIREACAEPPEIEQGANLDNRRDFIMAPLCPNLQVPNLTTL